MNQWTVDQVRAVGATTDVPTAGAVLGIGRTTAYQLVQAGQFPVPVLRLGRRIVVPVPYLLAVLGAPPGPGAPGPTQADRLTVQNCPFHTREHRPAVEPALAQPASPCVHEARSASVGEAGVAQPEVLGSVKDRAATAKRLVLDRPEVLRLACPASPTEAGLRRQA